MLQVAIAIRTFSSGIFCLYLVLVWIGPVDDGQLPMPEMSAVLRLRVST